MGCEERVWAEGREEKYSPAAVSDTETSDEGTGNGTAIHLTVGLTDGLRMRRNLAGGLSTP